MNAAVVIPTYNERENIGRLLTQLRQLPIPLTMLVVDDSSPDGTADVVRMHAAEDQRVELYLKPRKMGLGPAYTTAFQYLLSRSPAPHSAAVRRLPTPEAIIQMDADFSHNPMDIPRLLSALDGADIAVGSRYAPGGRTENWALRRRLLSRAANAYARTLTRVSVRDLTGGFNAWKANLLRAVDPHSIAADGYGYLIAMKTRAARLGARMVEVPITFTERREGASKLSSTVIWEAAWLVARLSIGKR